MTAEIESNWTRLEALANEVPSLVTLLDSPDRFEAERVIAPRM